MMESRISLARPHFERCRLRIFSLDESETQAAHAEHDRRRNDGGGDRASDHEAVRESLAGPMCHHHRTRPRRDVRENEEYPQPIMGQETDVPWILDEAGWRTRGEFHPVSMPRYVRAKMKTEFMWPST